MPPKKLIPACPICGGDMQVEYSVNMEVFAGRAGWHMGFQPRMKMCKNCSDSLLIYTERWFKARNKTNFYRKRWCPDVSAK